MNITDEVLSAFLDGELPEPEMQAIRQRLRDDPALGDRLAELAAVDERVSAHYSAIDEKPLPETVTAMLERARPSSTRVVSFPWWRRMKSRLHQHTGMAVAAALVAGFGVAQLMTGGPAGVDTQWQSVAQGLETTPSGESRLLATGEQLTPRITFVNQQGEYCRQFRLQGEERASENIACRESSDGSPDSFADTTPWTLAATVQLDVVAQPGSYQTASGGSVLDSALNNMMAEDILEPEAEKQLIDGQWATLHPGR